MKCDFAACDLNVMMTIQAFTPLIGGGELQLERLLPRLRARGVRTVVFTRAVLGTPSRDVIAGSPVYRTAVAGESSVASVVYVLASIVYLLRHWRTTDIVHAHGAFSPATIALVAGLLGKPCIVTVLGAGPPGDLSRLVHKPGGRRRLGLLARRARFVALSTEIVSELERAGVPREHVTLVPNGVDLTAYRPATSDERAHLRMRLDLDSDRCWGVFVGRLHPVKSVDTLLRALQLTTALDLVVVGDGTERASLEALARDLGVDSRVRFIGFTDSVAEYLRASDVFLLPSLGEGMSNALLEAMACGLACIVTTAVGGIDQLLSEARGITVAPGDVSGWADAMNGLVSDGGLRRELGSAAASFVRSELSIDATADRLTAVYIDVARER